MLYPVPLHPAFRMGTARIKFYVNLSLSLSASPSNPLCELPQKLRNTALNFCHQMKYMVHCMVEYWLSKWHSISISWFQYKVVCKILRITDFYFMLQLYSCILKLLTCSHRFQIVVEHFKSVITWIICPPVFLCSVSVKYLTVWKLVLFSCCKNSVWKNYKLWKFVFENRNIFISQIKVIYFVVMFINTGS